MYIAKGGLDSAFSQFHISLNGGSLFYFTLWSLDVRPASYPSVLPSSVNNSFLQNNWVEFHQSSLDRSIPFQTCSKISTSSRKLVALSTKRKHSKILSKTSCQISKEFVGHPLPMLFKLFHCFKNMTARGRYQFFYVNIGETLLVFFYLK